MSLYIPYFPLSSNVAPTNGSGQFVGQTWVDTVTGNVYVCYDATAGAAKWRHIPRVLGASAVQVSHTGDTAEFTLATITVPANAMGANGILRVTAHWSWTNSVNTKNARCYFNTTSGTNFMNLAPTTTTGSREQRQLANRNAANSQVYGTPAGGNATGGWSTGTGALLTSAVDTTQAVNIVFTGQLTNSGETIAIEDYLIELMRPDIT